MIRGDYMKLMELNKYQTPQPTNLSREKIFEVARKIANTTGFLPGNDIRNYIKKVFNAEIVDQKGNKYKNIDTSKDALFVNSTGSLLIFLKDGVNDLRKNFTIAHELGHYILHSQFGIIPIRAYRYGSHRLEWEANWFAAEFLMPQEEITKLKNEGLTSVEMSDHFQVSVTAMNIRIESLGL
ncbi:MAG: ImmA/IrrE family metallo-endopeptidase [Candidatus Cloacimonetes bacterium]|nr:ImmA/IrrE family metallo-endopeptidase [Candidatus Cloacimonadota bacterium]